MSTFAFVILHYNTFDDTHACVESVRKYVKGATCHIIIVDNCSPNMTGIELKKEYENDQNVIVLLNKENLGFAKGNNVGFKYAKDVLDADYIILLNSDTELLDDQFVFLVEQEYTRSNFALLGPMIRLPYSPYVQEMGRCTLITIHECFISIFILSWYYFLSLVGLDSCFRNSLLKKNRPSYCQSLQERKENIQIHGCFLVFSPEYIKEFDGLNPNTFLYREEELLSLRLKQNGLKSVYYPAIQILHKGKSATRSLFHNNRAKRRFEYRERIKSTYVLLKELSKA